MPRPTTAGGSCKAWRRGRSRTPSRTPTAGPAMSIELAVNGQIHRVDVEPRMTLLDCLRDKLLLTGAQAGGYAITTIEGLTPAPGELSVLQDAFCETHGMQCGYCTPAMILAAHALLAGNPAPTRDEIVEAISGNICRCTGYAQIVEAIALAAE